jgi:hypothetical protein
MVLFTTEPVATPQLWSGAACPEADVTSSQNPAAPPPLDEDLFSDLTLGAVSARAAVAARRGSGIPSQTLLNNNNLSQ